MKEFKKSVNSYQRYEWKSSGTFLWAMVYVTDINKTIKRLIICQSILTFMVSTVIYKNTMYNTTTTCHITVSQSIQKTVSNRFYGQQHNIATVCKVHASYKKSVRLSVPPSQAGIEQFEWRQMDIKSYDFIVGYPKNSCFWDKFDKSYLPRFRRWCHGCNIWIKKMTQQRTRRNQMIFAVLVVLLNNGPYLW